MTIRQFLRLCGAGAVCVVMAQCDGVSNWTHQIGRFEVATVSQVAPAAAANNVTTKLTVTGTNLRPGVTVQVGGVDCTHASVLSSTELTCIYPGNPAACGGQNVVLTTPEDFQTVTLDAAHGLQLTLGTLFAPASSFPATGSGSATAADFNGDGNLDVAITTSDHVSVQLGNGSGGFAAGASVPVTPMAGPVTLGDFNGDQNADLAVVSGSGVSILLGDGRGSFAVARNFAGGPGLGEVAVGDFNGDHKLDLAVGSAPRSVAVLLGDGMGGFAAPTTLALNHDIVTQVVVGDFNGDMKSDLAVATYPGVVSLLLGDGMGGFSAATDFSVGNNADGMATGDLNGDLNSDLVVSDPHDFRLSVLLGDGKGGFAAPRVYKVDNQTEPLALVLGDFNGDKRQDAAFIAISTAPVYVMLGDGMGNLASATPLRAGPSPYSITTGDFDHDGQLDLALAGFTDHTFAVFLHKCP